MYGHRIGNVSVASDVEGAYDVPVASMLPVGMTGGSCPVGDGAGLRSGGMPAVLSSDGECIACVADGAMPDEFRSGDVLVGKRIVDFGAVDTDGLTPYVFALRSGGLMVRRVIADKNFPEKLLLVAGSPDRRQFPDIVVKRADLCGVWDVKFTLVSYGSGGGNIGERLSELERRMDELTKRIDDAASAGVPVVEVCCLFSRFLFASYCPERTGCLSRPYAFLVGKSGAERTNPSCAA